MNIEPFEISIPEAAIADLHRRLDATRWSEDFGNADGHYGVPGEWLRDLVDHWRHRYDWRATEAAMNALPQYRVDIAGVPIHFVHLRSKVPDAQPLIITHGWPWTFWDFKDAIGPLTDPAAHGGEPSQAVDLVIPSLPGFGFSSPLRTTGMDLRRTATLWDTLMRDVLGYPRYAAAGGDWGSMVTAMLGNMFPDHLTGVHMTLLAIPGGTGNVQDRVFADDEAWMAERMAETLPLISSHMAVHRADPQTLAWALNDSPVGLAAWLWERRRAWSDPQLWHDSPAERNFLCDTASVYWFTGTIGTSMRFYRDNVVLPAMDDHTPRIPTPTAYGVAPKDIVMMSRSVAEKYTNLQRWTHYTQGGHFLPHENPTEWAADVRTFIADQRQLEAGGSAT